MKNLLSIKNLHVSVDETEILKGIDLSLEKSQIHAIMGPNGSGKSTLSKVIAGHPDCSITDGSLFLEEQDLQKLSIPERAQAGIFLAFQNPLEIEGITIRDFLYHAYQAKCKNQEKRPSVGDFKKILKESIDLLLINPEFLDRSLNLGFSGGEKKRAEILQLAVLKPKLAILDEIDSGLDVDALKIVCRGITTLKKENPDMTILIITHYPRILNYLVPDAVHIMSDGKIIQSGTEKLAQTIEKEGYSKTDLFT